jgi:hypothetical protein
VIAQPLASRKLTKRLYRTVKKGIWFALSVVYLSIWMLIIT